MNNKGRILILEIAAAVWHLGHMLRNLASVLVSEFQGCFRAFADGNLIRNTGYVPEMTELLFVYDQSYFLNFTH